MSSIFIICLWLAIIISISFIVKKIYPEQKEIIRKIIHIGSAPLLPLGIYLNLNKEIAVIGSSLVTILILLNYKIKIIPFIEDVKRRSFGTIFYCLSITILVIFFWEKYQYCAYIGVFLMSISDGFASIIGKSLKSYKWKVFNCTKSLAGTLAMLSFSLVILYIITSIFSVNIELYKLLFVGVFATALEQISILGIDNLTVPLITAFIIRLL